MGYGRWRAAAASALLVFLALAALAGGPVAARTLDGVRDRGAVRCGAAERQAFVSPDEKGGWKGFEVDFCKAIAAAVLGNAEAVEIQLLGGALRFEAMANRDVDVLFATTTWTLSRDAELGLSFAATYFYDGQAFLAHKSVGTRTLAGLRDATVCVAPGTTSEKNLEDYIRTRNPSLRVGTVQTRQNPHLPFLRRDCTVLTDDASGLIATRATLLGDPDDFVLFPERISKEPLSVAVQDDDPQWFDVVRWTVFGLIAAEEKGITAAGAESLRAGSTDAEVRRMLGVEGDIGKGLGLDRDWLYRMVRQVGNYGEIYERSLGRDSPHKLDRGLNALWTQGGLMYAPPIR